MVQQAVGKIFCSSVKGSAKAAVLSRRVPMVSNSDAGSYDTTQWNFVMDRVTRYAAKVDLICRNHA